MPLRCPWYMGYALLIPLRRLYQNPEKILGPYVREGDVVLEPGPGMGYFTLDLARLVGPTGKVHAVDIEPRMLKALERRALKAGLADRVVPHLADETGLGLGDLAGPVDFVLAFAVVHEMPDVGRFFAEIAATLKPEGRILFAEPGGHVSPAAFETECRLAAEAGLDVIERPKIPGSRAAVLSHR